MSNQDKATQLNPISELIEVLQGAETELAENDGYDLCKPLGVRVALNSLLAGLGVEPKDLEGEQGTAVDPALVVAGRSIVRAVNSHDALLEALKRIEKWFGEFPETGRFWDEPKNTDPMSYAACFGSNGERDYMREVARAAIKLAEGER